MDRFDFRVGRREKKRKSTAHQDVDAPPHQHCNDKNPADHLHRRGTACWERSPPLFEKTALNRLRCSSRYWPNFSPFAAGCALPGCGLAPSANSGKLNAASQRISVATANRAIRAVREHSRQLFPAIEIWSGARNMVSLINFKQRSNDIPMCSRNDRKFYFLPRLGKQVFCDGEE